MNILLTLIVLLFSSAVFAQEELELTPTADAQAEDPLYKDATILEATEGSDAEPINFDTDKAAATETSDAIEALTAVANPEKDDLSSTSGYVAFNGVDFDTLNSNIDSLFFTREQLDLLYSKIRKFKLTGKNVPEASDNASGTSGTSGAATGEDAKYTYVTVYLGSILYPSDGDWTIWVNDTKVRKENAESNDSGLVIKSVNQNSASILYHEDVKKLLVNSPNYKTQLKHLDSPETDDGSGHSWDYVSDDGTMKLESNTGVVLVKLKISQTFSLYDMQIMEGRYQPAGAQGDTTANASATGADVTDLDVPNTMYDVGQTGNAGLTTPKKADAAPVKKAPDERIEALSNMKILNDEIAEMSSYDYTKDPDYMKIVAEDPSVKQELDKFADSINAAAAKYKDKLVSLKGMIDAESEGKTVIEKTNILKLHDASYTAMKRDYTKEVKDILTSMLVRFPPKTEAANPTATPENPPASPAGASTTK